MLLGDVESRDERRYRYILAVIPPGASAPSLFVTAEAQDFEIERGPQALCIYDETGERGEIDVSREWLHLEAFADRALTVVRERLGLSDAVEQLM